MLLRRLLLNLSISIIAINYGCSNPNLSVSSAAAKRATIIDDLPLSQVKNPQTIVLAGGCFWGVEAVFERLKGVSTVVSGFAGGSRETANYEAVSRGETGHAEAVQITYDPTQISYGQLLKVFFTIAHDPTELNRQGPDAGTQYRSAIFVTSPEQQRVTQAYIDRLKQMQIFPKPIVTQLTTLTKFYPAAADHQNFIDRHPTDPYVVVHDLPKLKHLRQEFPELVKPQV